MLGKQRTKNEEFITEKQTSLAWNFRQPDDNFNVRTSANEVV